MGGISDDQCHGFRNVKITIIQIRNFGCLTLENETRHENEVGNTSKPMSQRTKEVEVGSF